MGKYEFIKITDDPSLGTEYVGEIETYKKHTKEHEFNLANKEQREKLIDIVMRYGITKDDFTDEDKENYPFFYDIMKNNMRNYTGRVYYYYSDDLVYLDALNKNGDKEKYANGILLYGNNDVKSVNTVYRLTEKETDKDKGYYKESLEDFKSFFKRKRTGHDFKKDLEEIINASDNAVEYHTKGLSKFYSNEKNMMVKRPLQHTAKSPRMEFIMGFTHLNRESQDKFLKYKDLKTFLDNFNKDEFSANEMKEFERAIEEISTMYMLENDLMNQFFKVMSEY